MTFYILISPRFVIEKVPLFDILSNLFSDDVIFLTMGL